MTVKMVAALGLALVVAGCGQTTSERTTGGAAAGAATGAGVGALGGPVGALAGAAVGAGAGAIAGATTRPEDVNLGRPPWTNPEARVPGAGTDERGARRRGMRTADAREGGDARQAQRALADRGYDPGPVDGVWGTRSTRALRDFQRASNLTETGRLDTRTMDALRTGGSATTPRTGTTGTTGSGTGTTGTGTTGTGTTGTGMGTSSTGTGMGTGMGTTGRGATGMGTTGTGTTTPGGTPVR